MTLRVALVGGPMYDGLYEVLGDDVDVVVHADHPTLNRRVAELLAAGERLDLISTHSKYAPSQAAFLRPLDGLLDTSPLAPLSLELCRYDGSLLCVPRNIDVRVLWRRDDLVPDPPTTWAELDASTVAFGFTGRESGLFGTFFEVVVSLGGDLFETDGIEIRPAFASRQCEQAVELLCRLATRCPPELLDWHYDDVDTALYAGEVAMAATWPGGFGSLRRSPYYRHLRPMPYFDGTSYSGCHAWGIPTTCGDPEAAVALVERLTSFESHRRDSASGTVPARIDTFAAVEAIDATDAARLEIIRATIAGGMITYPPHPAFPRIEDAGWSAVRDALAGDISPADAVTRLQEAATEILADSPSRTRA